MKLMAYSLCSSSPVAMARMFGSMMMSEGSNPAFSVSRRYARCENRDLAFHGVGLALFVERHHDDGRAVALHELRLCRKSASPSLSEMELTTDLPCTHFRPAR
jgi:hypothetical protein